MKPREQDPESGARDEARPANDAPPVRPNAEPEVIYRVGEGAPEASAPGVRSIARAGVRVVLLPDAPPANDEGEGSKQARDADALLAADPEFAALCDARREAWIEAMELSFASEVEPEPAAEGGATEREGHGHDGT